MMKNVSRFQELSQEDKELKEELEALDPEERAIVIAMAADAMVNFGNKANGKGDKQED